MMSPFAGACLTSWARSTQPYTLDRVKAVAHLPIEINLGVDPRNAKRGTDGAA